MGFAPLQTLYVIILNGVLEVFKGERPSKRSFRTV